MALLSFTAKTDFVWWQFWVWPHQYMMAMLSLHRKSDFVWWQCLSIWWHCSVSQQKLTLSDGNSEFGHTNIWWQCSVYTENPTLSDGNALVYDGTAQFTQKIRLCLMAIIKRKRLLMEMLSFDRNRLMIAMFNPMEMISFDRKRLLMAMLSFSRHVL